MQSMRTLLVLASMTLCATSISFAAQDDDLDDKLDGRVEITEGGMIIESEKFKGGNNRDNKATNSGRYRDQRDNDSRRSDRRDRYDDRVKYKRDRYDDRGKYKRDQYDDRGKYKRGWDRRGGYDDGGYYATTETTSLYCRARDDNGGRRYCRAPRGADRIYFERRRSDSPCRKGRDWGIDRGGVWVDNGCRANFTVVVSYSGYGQYGRNPGYDRQYDRDSNEYISCESQNNRYKTCRLPSGARDVRLASQRSDAPCRKDRDWGVARGGIWVDNGCRGTFTVDYRRNRDRYSGGW